MEQQGEKQICLREITAYAIMSPKGWGPQEIKEYFLDEELANKMVEQDSSVAKCEVNPTKFL